VYWTRSQLKADYRSSRKAMKRWSFMRRHLHKAVKIDNMLFAHGTPESYFIYIDSIAAAKDAFAEIPEGVDTLFVGHTHVAGVYVEDTDGFIRWIGPYAKKYPSIGELRMIINVGSVGQPRDGDIRSSYVLVGGKRFFFRRIPYDIAAAVQSIKSKEHLPNFSADRLIDGA
jgi:diadenosine tetraphosphatase ApaH/serine/threonine PP2A family protein phosphatase